MGKLLKTPDEKATRYEVVNTVVCYNFASLFFKSKREHLSN